MWVLDPPYPAGLPADKLHLPQLQQQHAQSLKRVGQASRVRCAITFTRLASRVITAQAKSARPKSRTPPSPERHGRFRCRHHMLNRHPQSAARQSNLLALQNSPTLRPSTVKSTPQSVFQQTQLQSRAFRHHHLPSRKERNVIWWESGSSVPGGSGRSKPNCPSTSDTGIPGGLAPPAAPACDRAHRSTHGAKINQSESTMKPQIPARLPSIIRSKATWRGGCPSYVAHSGQCTAGFL